MSRSASLWVTLLDSPSPALSRGLAGVGEGNLFVKESGRQHNVDMKAQRIATDGKTTLHARVASISRRKREAHRLHGQQTFSSSVIPQTAGSRDHRLLKVNVSRLVRRMVDVPTMACP